MGITYNIEMSRKRLLKRSNLSGGGGSPLTIVQTDTKFNTGANVHTLTAVPAGALIVITTANQFSNQQCTVTSTPSLTFTRAVDNGVPNAEIFTTTFVAGGNITITVNWGTNVQTSVCYVLTQQDTVNGAGATAPSQPVASVGVTTTRTNSIIFCVSTNWNVPDGGPGGTSTLWRGSPVQSMYYRDPNAATFWHYYYNAQNIQPYTVGYISPNDVDAGTGTAVLEIRSASGANPVPDTTAPTAFSLSSPSKTHNTINLSWTASTDNVGVTGYEIRNGGSLITTVSQATLSYQITGLTPSTVYNNINVTARDAAGNGTASNTISVTTDAAPVDTTPPSTPVISSSTITSASISVNWTASTDNVGLANYQVYLNGGVVNTVSTATLSYTYTGLTPATSYALRVRAVDTSGNFADSNTINITTNAGSDTQAPTAPVLTSTNQDVNTVDLDWTASTDNIGVTEYQIHRVGAPSNPIAVVNSSLLFYTVTGLSGNTNYQFFVRAVDAAGNGTNSNTVSVTTDTVPVGGQTVTFTALSGDYSRYWGGSEFWGTGELAVSGVPATMHRYRRFTWRDLEGDTINSFRFNEDGGRFKTFLEQGIANKQLVSFGLITNYPCLDGGNSFHDKSNYGGSYSAYPAYLHNLMQGEATTDWRSFACNGSGHWVPNYNSPSYISRLNALYAALNTFLQTMHPNGQHTWGDAVGYIDVRGVGSWGEWHHNATTANNVLNASNFQGYIQPFDGPAGNDANPSSNGTFPSWTRVRQIIDAHTDNLNDWPLTTILNSLDGNFSNGSSPYGTGFMNTLIHRRVGQYLMDNGNAWGNIGWRRDQWGDTANYYLLVQNSGPITGVDTRWQTAPVTGEPPGYVANGGSCGCHMGAFPTQGVIQHASIVGNSNYGSAPDGNSMRTGFQSIGCILRMTTGTINLTATQLIITLNWRNFGVSPQYNHWDTVFELRNSGGSLVWTNNSTFDPFLFLPSGTSTQNVDIFARPSIPAGTYTLSVILKDPNGYKVPLQLGINGRQSNGSYNLINLNF